MIGIFMVVLALVMAPLLLGVINRTKAFFAGRNGPPVLQLYYDLRKLLGKGAVYSKSTTWVFVAGPAIGLAAVVIALLLLPMGALPAVVAFPGDLLLFAYLLGLLRFFTVAAALDTGSAFEGMGASREVAFSMLAEPALFIALAAMARLTGGWSLSSVYCDLHGVAWSQLGPAMVLVAAALFVVSLAENCRIPVDDPNTHLELTMIHEVMVLDHCGVDLAFILYAAALKFWLLSALVVGVLLPLPGAAQPLVSVGGFVGGMLLIAVLTGVVESVMARLRMFRVNHLLAGAGVMAAVAMALVLH